MRRGRRNVLASFAGVGLAAVACWGVEAAERWSLARGYRRALEGPPNYTGRIVVPVPYHGRYFLLLSPDGRPDLGVSLRPSTPFGRRDGGVPVLATGQTVSLWAYGPILMSNPAQCEADRVVIEADGPQAAGPDAEPGAAADGGGM